MGIFGRKQGSRIASPLRVARSRNALVSSGFRVKQKDTDTMRRLIQPWQARSFSYYDQVPEIKYAAQFYARLLSPLKLYAAEIDENGDLIETTNQDAIDALERIQDPGGGRSGLLGTYGRLMFLTGECYLFVSTDPETKLEQWEMLSTDELRVQSGVYTRYKAPSLMAEEYHDSNEDDDAEGAWIPIDDDAAVAYRLWQRHPRFSMLADSTMQGVLDIAEELLLLTQAVRARARSRLAGSGILFFDERISPVPDEPAPDEDMKEDPFLADLTEAMTTPIVDEGSAAQVVPLTVRVPVPDNGKVSDLVYHLQIVDPIQLYPETGLRMECVKRLAIGLDMPPEELLGLADSNHWSAWMVDEQTWKAHGQPKAQQLCDDLTSSYFRPFLRQVMKVPNWQNFTIAYDATAIINHPDRSKDAKDLWDKGAISLSALRDAAGFTEDDAPSEQDRAERIGILTRDSSLAWFGIPSVKAGGIEPEAGVVESPGMPPTGEPVGPGTGAEVQPGPPKSNGSEPTSEVGSLLAARILGASDLALLRVREAAGSRIRTGAKKHAELRDLIVNVPAREIACVLGRERVRTLRLSERDLVSGSQDLIVDLFRGWGLLEEGMARVVADTIEQHAARTLYEKHPSPLPASFTNYVSGLVMNKNGK